MAFHINFDELNRRYAREHGDNLRSMPYDQFFGEMDLSEEQKEKREKTAREIEQFIILALASMYYLEEAGSYDYGPVMNDISRNYSELLVELGISLTAFFETSHPDSVAAEIVTATMNHPDDPYFYSEDRAMLIAENEANSIYNDSEYADAILTGKTRKQWRAILDNRTRDSHRDMNGTEISIDEPFEVNGYLMMFPRDEMMGAGPEEIVNCRCSALYY